MIPSTLTGPSGYKYIPADDLDSSTDLASRVNGNVLPYTDVGGITSLLRQEDVLFLAEMAIERGYLTYGYGFGDGDKPYDLFIKDYPYGRDSLVNGSMFLDALRGMIWSDYAYKHRRGQNLSSLSDGPKLRIACLSGSVTYLSGFIDPDFSVETVIPGYCDDLNDMWSEIGRAARFRRTKIPTDSVVSADTLRSVYYDLSRMCRFVDSVNIKLSEYLTWDIFKNACLSGAFTYPGNMFIGPVLATSDGESTRTIKYSPKIYEDFTKTSLGYTTPRKEWYFDRYYDADSEEYKILSSTLTDTPSDFALMTRFRRDVSSPTEGLISGECTAVFTYHVTYSITCYSDLQDEDSVKESKAGAFYVNLVPKLDTENRVYIPSEGHPLSGVGDALYTIPGSPGTLETASKLAMIKVRRMYPSLGESCTGDVRVLLSGITVVIGKLNFRSTVPEGWSWKPDPSSMEKFPWEAGA